MRNFGIEFGFREFNAIMKRANKVKLGETPNLFYPLGTLSPNEFIDLIMPENSLPTNHIPLIHSRETYRRA